MNSKIIVVFFLTIAALVLLTLYSFGPLARQRVSRRINPASLKPAPVAKTVAAASDTIFVAYHNRDSREDYFTVAFPHSWQVQAVRTPGSYGLAYAGGAGSVELMDVPDKATLELYTLSQEEPRLRKSKAGYERIDYHKLLVNGNEAHQFVYRFKADTSDSQTVRTYISGQNQAGVTTFTVRPSQFDAARPVFNAVLNTFSWENR